MSIRLALLVPIAAIAAACGGSGGGMALPQGSEPVDLDPADFTATIDHPYWPMKPGSRWLYRETDADGTVSRIVVTVTPRTKRIAGVDARVVHDVLTEEGEVKEDTLDWYAQDAAGNVWYLGEDTKEYDEGKTSTAGSWEAGVDGAQAGILLPAEPEAGQAYRQEYARGEAEDAAETLSVDERVDVPFGSFDHVLMTKEFTPLEPNVLEHKFYAQGVGPVLALTLAGGSDREELLEFSS